MPILLKISPQHRQFLRPPSPPFAGVRTFLWVRTKSLTSKW